MAICGHLPGQLKRDLNDVATLNQTTHRLTSELNKDQAEILERAKAKYRQVYTVLGKLQLQSTVIPVYNVCMCTYEFCLAGGT